MLAILKNPHNAPCPQRRGGVAGELTVVGSWLRERDKGVIPTSRDKSGTSGHRGGRKEEPVEGEESAVGKEKSVR